MIKKAEPEKVSDQLADIEEDYNVELQPTKIKAEWKAPSEPEKPVEVQYYTVERWKGVRDVYKCSKCGAFRDSLDEMKLHIIAHYIGQEESILELLMNKEK